MATSFSDPLPGATLHWRNGDSLAGQIVESDDEKVHWLAKPFAAPLVLDLEQLEGIRFPKTESAASPSGKPRFRITLKNGDRLEGELVSISRKEFGLRNGHFAETVTIPRSVVAHLVQVTSSHLRYTGPQRLENWTSTGRDRKPDEWFTDLSGAFATHQWSGNLFKEIALPNATEIHFSATFPDSMPNLEIGLVRNATKGPMIETWGTSLVLTYQTEFAPIMELDDDTRELEFRLFWNQASGDLRLCDPTGRLLASMSNVVVPRKSEKKRNKNDYVRGFSILNRSPKLKLHTLTVKNWDGLPAPLIDLSRPHFVITGRDPQFRVNDISLAPGSSTLRVGGRSAKLTELEELFLDRPDSIVDESVPHRESRIAWASGTTLSGQFLKLSPSAFHFQPSWASAPLVAQLDEAEEIRFPGSDQPPLRSYDRLTSEGVTLGGTTAPINEGDGAIGWRALGAQAPVPFAESETNDVLRTPHAANLGIKRDVPGRARLYLVNDEILIGTLRSMTKETIEFNSRVTGPISVPASVVRAIDLGCSGRVLKGFGDPAWETIEETKGEVTMTDTVTEMVGGAFGNPYILLGNRIKFKMEWGNSRGAITIRLFAADGNPKTPSTDIIISARGGNLYVLRILENGVFRQSNDDIALAENWANLEIVATLRSVELIANGASLLQMDVDPKNTSGNGIYFKMGDGTARWHQADSEIAISEFEVERAAGTVPQQFITAKAKESLLTIPRSQRDPVPTHLLIGPNGDLLRGHLESIRGGKVRFSSKGEMVELLQSRVSAIVRLRPADGESSAPSKSEQTENREAFTVTHQLVLMNGSRLSLASRSVSDNQFIGDSPLLGTCTIPIANIREMRAGPPRRLDELKSLAAPLFADWTFKLTPDPIIPGTATEPTSPLIGKPAPSVKLSLLDKSSVKLPDLKGEVVVLDFWATWSGPSIKAMPDVLRAVSAFPEGAVNFFAVNQAETLPIIESFLRSREWSPFPVALDFDMKISQAFEVEAIPMTVVIGKDGKIAWLHQGYSPDLKEKLFEAISIALQQ